MNLCLSARRPHLSLFLAGRMPADGRARPPGTRWAGCWWCSGRLGWLRRSPEPRLTGQPNPLDALLVDVPRGRGTQRDVVLRRGGAAVGGERRQLYQLVGQLQSPVGVGLVQLLDRVVPLVLTGHRRHEVMAGG